MGMKRLAVLSLLAALAAGAARAEDARPKPGVLSWFKNWKSSLERSAVEGKYRKMRTATGVAAVRGSGQAAADADETYWKGGWSEKREKERAKEREELASAVGLIMDGKSDEARTALTAFEKAHPKSSFLGEVKEARAKLEEMEGKGAPEAPAAEAKPAAAPAQAESAPAPKPEAAQAEAPKAEEPKAEPAEAPKAEPAPEAKPADAAPAKAD